MGLLCHDCGLGNYAGLGMSIDQLTWFGSDSKYNCQDYADELRRAYYSLENDKEVRCRCKKGDKK